LANYLKFGGLDLLGLKGWFWGLIILNPIPGQKGISSLFLKFRKLSLRKGGRI